MRKWLIEETGEYREVKFGEYYLFGAGQFGYWDSHPSSLNQYTILKVTEFDKKEIVSFDEWNW